LKEWWTNGRQEDLYQWFCVDKIEVCCPPKHYGPNCLPCKGYPNICNLHGTCKVSTKALFIIYSFAIKLLVFVIKLFCRAMELERVMGYVNVIVVMMVKTVNNAQIIIL